MNVLIVGANGFLGTAIADAAASRGLKIFGLSRSGRPAGNFSGIYLSGDRRHTARVADIVARERIDVVVDVIAMTSADTETLLAALNDRIHQYVMLSSCDVYRNYELLHRKAAGSPDTGAVDEHSALRTTRYPYRDVSGIDAALRDYDKIPIEQAVQRLTTPWTILRLPMVYGPGDKQHRFDWIIKPMAADAPVLEVPEAFASWESTYGYVDNVAAAVASTLGDDRAENEIFNVAEPEPVTQLEWVEKIAQIMGWRGVVEVSGRRDSPLARRIANLDLSVPLRVSDLKIRQALGFVEPVDSVTALRRTIAERTLTHE